MNKIVLTEENSLFECEGYDCERSMFCVSGYSLYSRDYSKVWKSIEVQVTFLYDQEDTCLLIESDDSSIRESPYIQNMMSLVSQHSMSQKPASERLSERKQNFRRESSLLSTLSSTYTSILKAMKQDRNNGPSRRETLHFSKFGDSCFTFCGRVDGKTRAELVVKENISFEDFYPILAISGFTLFLFSRFLSNQVIFYYATGVSVGVVFALGLLLTLLLSPLFSKRQAMLIATSLQSVAIYYFSVLKRYYLFVLEEHAEYIFYIFCFIFILSLSVTHYMLKTESGFKVTSSVRDIVRVLIKSIGLILLYNSTSSVSRSLILVATVFIYDMLSPLLFFLCPTMTFSYERSNKLSDRYLYREKWLSGEEYNTQGKIETNKAMSELLSSNDFKHWIQNNQDRIKIDKLD